MSLSLFLKNQELLTTQLSRQISGTQGPTVNFLRTAILGDQKLSQTSTMNSTISKRLAARLKPTERTIGKKLATLTTMAPELRTVGSVTGLPLIGYGVTKGIVDAEQKDSMLKGLGQTSILGAGVGALTAGIHRFAYPKHFKLAPLATTVSYIIGMAAATPLIYGLAHSGGSVANKILYTNAK